MASVEEVKAHVAASVDGTQRAVSGIQQVTDQLDEALARLRLTAFGSVHPTVLTAISHLEQAKSRLDEAATLARAAMDSANQYRSIA
jgi:molecular chaperone GrpE (heat shock protein)